jgi:hypothetical protein
MTELIEKPHSGNFILSEDNEGRLSRDVIIVAAAAGKLLPGTVLGRRTADGALDAVVAVRAGNTGNGVLAFANPKTAAGAKPGVYTVVCATAAVGGGRFRAEDPDGVEIGEALVGAAFGGAVKFTIAAGGADFVVGDAFDITVIQAAATNKFAPSPETATDGSDRAAAILVHEVDATHTDVTAVAIARHAEVNRHGLLYHASIDDGPKQSVKWDQLWVSGIVVR